MQVSAEFDLAEAAEPCAVRRTGRYHADMRVLGAGRLSRLSDETASPARQKDQITGWAAIHGHTVTTITMDLDVSGS